MLKSTLPLSLVYTGGCKTYIDFCNDKLADSYPMRCYNFNLKLLNEHILMIPSDSFLQSGMYCTT